MYWEVTIYDDTNWVVALEYDDIVQRTKYDNGADRAAKMIETIENQLGDNDELSVNDYRIM